jgi:signal peptidase II
MPLGSFGRRAVVVSALFILVGCDHVTKYAAKSQLQGAPNREVVRGIVNLQYVENTDVAFNLLRWIPDSIRKPLLTATGGIVMLGLVALAVTSAFGRVRRRSIVGAGLLLVTAGAVGNGLDRVARGYVVDFVRVPHWPVFNVADVYVTAGAALLGVAAWRASQSRAAPISDSDDVRDPDRG